MRLSLSWILVIVATACADGRIPALTVGEVELTLPDGSAEPNLFARGDRVHLSWLDHRPDRTYALRFATRSGGRWSDPLTIVEGGSFFANWADFPSIVELEDGTLMAHWLEKVGPGTYAYHIRAKLSHDGGQTWTAPLVPHSDRSDQEHGFVTILPLPSGDAGIVWLDGREMSEDEGDGLSGPMQLRFTTVSPNGEVAPDVMIDDRTCECCQTSLAQTSGGLIVAYRNRTPEEIRDIAVSRRIDGTWSAPMIVADEQWYMPACPVNGPQLATSGDTVALAWYTGADGDVRTNLAFSTDAGATFGAPIRFDGGLPIGRVDVELFSASVAVAVWVENTGSRAEVSARVVTIDGRVGPRVVVSPTSEARASGFPRVARVGDQLVFAWTEPGSESRVKVTTVQVDW